MRILQLITLSELGGAQSVVINLANKLCENHEVIVVAGEGDGKMYELLDKRVKIDHIPSLVRRLSPIKELQSILTMRQLFRKYKPDIIHLHSSKAGILGRIAFPKSKIVYTVHGFDSIRIAYRKYLPVERFLQKRCAYIVGVSKYDEINLNLEGIKHNVTYIYNGISEPISLKMSPFDAMSKYRNKILCIARLTPQKNHQLFLETARLLPEYAFIWIGNQEEPQFKYPKNVFFLGNIKDAGSYTEFADLFFLPSNYEGLPMVIIESLSKGTPVIASAVGGITELLNGKNGWALENDAILMSKAIQRYFTRNSEEIESIKSSARSTYNEKFTVDKMANGYLKIYTQIYRDNNK